MLQVAIVLDVGYPNLLSKNIIQEICVSPDGAAAPGFSVPRRLRLGRGAPLRVDRLQTDALALKGIGPGDHGAQQAGPDQENSLP
jgi:hypothetical protein